MERFKRAAWAVVHPPIWLAFILTLPSFALVIWTLASGQSGTPLAYLSYGLSAYALVIVCVRIPGIVRACRTGFEGHPLVYGAVHSAAGERLRGDAFYRAQLSLYMGLGVNLLYVVIKAASGIVYQSRWFGVLAGYYLLLSLMRFALTWYVVHTPIRQNLLSEWRRYRLCGVVLLAMNQALGAVVYLMERQDYGFEYPGLLVYVMAMYTFYAVISAVWNMVKFKRHGSPVLSAAKAVSFVSALVSLLALEKAMLTQFGEPGQERFSSIMVGLTGIAVCAAVLALAIEMIRRANRAIAHLKKEEHFS